MTATKPKPATATALDERARAFGAWMMSNVRREIAAGRVRDC